MMVLRLEGLNKELNQGLSVQIQKSAKYFHTYRLNGSVSSR